MKLEAGCFWLLMIGVIAACGHDRPPSHTKTTMHRESPCDHLVPLIAPVTDPQSGTGLYQKVLAATLFRDRPDLDQSSVERLVVAMIREDPRRPQDAIYVSRSLVQGTPKYRLIHAQAKEQVLFQESSVGVQLTEVELDATMVQALERSWGAMALGARWPNRSDMISRHVWRGTSYTFEFHGDNVFGQGDAISPLPGTCSAKLVELAELLIKFAHESNEPARKAIREQLLRRSDEIANLLGRS